MMIISDITDQMDNLAPKHCAICIQVFQGKDEFENHQSVVHRKIYYPCDLCNKRYRRRYNLRTHIKINHKSAKENLACPSCQKLFEVRSTFLSHIERRHEEKSLPCDICEQKFSSKGNLTKHQERKHIGSKTFPVLNVRKCFTMKLM